MCELATALGHPMHYDDVGADHGRDRRAHAHVPGVSFAKLDEVGSVQWPCNDAKPLGTPIMHEGKFVRGLGRFTVTPYVPTEEKSTRRFPLLLTTGRILSQYNVGAQTRRTENVQWHGEDVLEIHPADAEERGIRTGDEVTLASRVGRHHAARRGVATAWRRAWCTPRSTTRSAAPTWSPPSTATGPPTARSTR